MDLNSLPDLITAPDANQFALNFKKYHVDRRTDTYFIKVVSGTWKFNAFGDATASGASITSADGVISVTVKDILSCKAANADETFKIFN